MFEGPAPVRSPAGLDRGERPEVVARRFEVGRSTVYRWVVAARGEGR